MEEGTEFVLTIFTGENDDIADSGRTGKFLAANAAFFCANMVSRRDGFGGPAVLLEKPNPGRTTGSAFFGEFGFAGSFCKSLICAGSSVAIIASALVGQI